MAVKSTIRGDLSVLSSPGTCTAPGAGIFRGLAFHPLLKSCPGTAQSLVPGQCIPSSLLARFVHRLGQGELCSASLPPSDPEVG